MRLPSSPVTSRNRETHSWGRTWMPKRVRLLVVAAVAVGCVRGEQAGAANFTGTTTYAVILPQARGLIPYASGSVKAKVSSSLALSLQFGLVNGFGYAAGTVTATTDTLGRLTKLARLAQECTISYGASGTASRARCTNTTSKRALREGPADVGTISEADVDIAELDDALGVTEKVVASAEGESNRDEKNRRRRLSDCSSCIDFVNSTISTQLRALCDATFAILAPSLPLWARSAFAALCAMSTKLGGDQVSRYVAAHQTCRCSCLRNRDCPVILHCFRDDVGMLCEGVCSNGICLGQQLGPGELCPEGDDNDCANGACARELYPLGRYVCCPSNDYIQEGPSDGEFYCTGQAARAACFDNAMCASPGACVGGVCRPTKLDDGEPCPERDDGDCSSGACGRASYPSGQDVCCPSGWKAAASSEPGTESYCAAILAVGAPCGSNDMCTSGVCSQGVCLAQPIGVGEPCPDAEYVDCANWACGRESYPSGRYVCCESNQVVPTSYWNGSDSYNITDYVCAGIQGVGSPCDHDEMCSSGVCTRGVCLAVPPQTGETCDAGGGNDCQNKVCARSSYPSGDYICCMSNVSTESRVRLDSFGDVYCTEAQGVGSPCDADEMCASGVCSGFVCRARKLDTGEPCDYDGEHCTFESCSDCLSGRCARDSYPSGATVCCDGDAETVWSTSYGATYCAGIQGIGLACDSNRLCASGVCEGLNCEASNRTANVSTLEPHHHKDMQFRCNPTGGEKYPFLVVASWASAWGDDGPFDQWDPRVGVSCITFTVPSGLLQLPYQSVCFKCFTESLCACVLPRGNGCTRCCVATFDLYT
jgi:hypothetical protein